MGQTAARILVVDDDIAFREFLALTLEHDGYEVCGAPDSATAMKAVATFRPDLAILDIMLNDGTDGLMVGRRLRDEGDVPILYLSAFEDPAHKLASFDAGADDYVVKGSPMPELRARVRALLRRTGRLTQTTWKIGELVIDEAAHTVDVGGHRVDLTKLEFEILATLARQHGRVVPKATLLSQVWGFNGFDANLVEVHVSSLRRKLGAHGPRYVQTVRGIGYVLRTPV